MTYITSFLQSAFEKSKSSDEIGRTKLVFETSGDKLIVYSRHLNGNYTISKYESCCGRYKFYLVSEGKKEYTVEQIKGKLRGRAFKINDSDTKQTFLHI